MAKNVTFRVGDLRALNAEPLSNDPRMFVNPLAEVSKDGKKCLYLFTTPAAAEDYLRAVRAKGMLGATAIGPLAAEDWLALLAGMQQQGVLHVAVNHVAGQEQLDLTTSDEMADAIRNASG